ERGKAAQSQNWPTRYRLTTGGGLTVFTNQVVVGTGLGSEKLPTLDAGSQQLITQERAKIDYTQPDKVPAILTYGEALGLANLSRTGRDAYRAPVAQPTKRVRDKQVGVRIVTEPASVLEANSGANRVSVPLSEVVNWSFDSRTSRWTIETKAGRQQ